MKLMEVDKGKCTMSAHYSLREIETDRQTDGRTDGRMDGWTDI